MRRSSIHRIEGTLACLSGLHIGGSGEDLQIGGTDLTVIRHPVTSAPYVPGSSLKGKMRAELEKDLGKVRDSEPCGCAKPDCPICRLFGPHKKANHDLGPTRLIVRDAPLVAGGEAELKAENVINRKTGAAEHPRKLERIVAGSRFSVTMTLQVYDLDEPFQWEGKRGKDALLAATRRAIELVEATGLGAGISRGSGQVRFENLKLDGNDWK